MIVTFFYWSLVMVGFVGGVCGIASLVLTLRFTKRIRKVTQSFFDQLEFLK